MQITCDHKMKIMDLCVGYPGSVHDSRVFRNSNLYNNLLERCGRYCILADSGYPLKANVLTPFKDRSNLTRRQQNYNVKLAKNRYVVEHCFGVLKQKFRQLYHLKLRSIPLIVHFIRAACVLHNISLEDNFEVEDDNLDEMNAENENEEVDARHLRDRVVNQLPM